jgi:hypothetical protein
MICPVIIISKLLYVYLLSSRCYINLCYNINRLNDLKHIYLTLIRFGYH